MENTIISFEIDNNASIDQNWQNLKSFEKSLLTIEDLEKPFLSRKPTAEEARYYARQLDIYEANKLAIKEQKELTKEIRQKAFEDFENYVKDLAGLFDIPEQYQANVWSLAYQRGHSSGYSEVYTNLVDLVEIFN